MSKGENETGLKKIADMTRLISIFLLLLHFYYCCYSAFVAWQLTSTLTDRLLTNITNTGLFKDFNNAKLISLGFLLVSLLGMKGKKDEKKKAGRLVYVIVAGASLFFTGQAIFYSSGSVEFIAIGYILMTSAGYLFMLSGGTKLSRLIKLKLTTDIFNELNETFPQEELLLQNDYSINLRTGTV